MPMNRTIRRLRRLRRLRHPTILAIIAVATAVFLVQELLGESVTLKYAAVPANISHAWRALLAGHAEPETFGALTTLVTPMFLHGGPDHILFNMIYLWVFGSLVSQHLGKWWALLLFFVTGVGGNVVHILLQPDSPVPMIGASGAVCGLGGVYFGLALRWRLDWPDVWPLARPIPPMQLALFAIVGVVIDFYMMTQRSDGIAHGAHIGGFLTGLAAAALMTQLYQSEEAFQRPRRRRS